MSLHNIFIDTDGLRVGNNQLLTQYGNVYVGSTLSVNGRILAGTDYSLPGANNVESEIQVLDTVGGNNAISAIMSSNDAIGTSLNFIKSRSDTYGTLGLVADADNLGSVRFLGSDGTGIFQGAAIVASVEGTPTTNSIPTKIEFQTTAVDGTSVSTGLTLNSNQQVTVAKTLSLTSTPGNNYIDFSNSNSSYAAAATVDFPTFSGMIMVNNCDATGSIDLWLCGGGAALRIANSASSSNTGTIAHNSAIGGYTWTNNTGGTVFASFAAFRTRVFA